MQPEKRYLIVNADDFGLSAETNRGIIQSHEQGIVTSASLMVRHPGAAFAAEYSCTHPELSLGLHFDIGEWAYRDGEWVEIYRAARTEDAEGIQIELVRQIERFRRLVGRNPTHLDSHQHIHREEPARSILTQAAQELGIPLRECSDTIRYVGNFYGQASHGSPWPHGISVPGLLETLEHLPAGITELGCHPGLDSTLDSLYRDERIIEVSTLCDPRIRSALDSLGISTLSFRDVEELLAGMIVPSL